MDAKSNEPHQLQPAPTTISPSASHSTRSRFYTRAKNRLGRVRWKRVALITAIVTVVASITTGSWWMTCGFDGCPSIAQLQAWRPTEGGRLLDRRGQVIGPLVAVRRVNVPLSRVPAHVQRAFIAVEDRRFHEHHGIDWQGVARAFVNNLRAGGVREGGSTITMQLARNVFLTDRAAERTFTRKFLEARYARLIEEALTKDQILERYLNAIYLGNGVYGVEGASRDLFGKGVHDVTLAEAAMLAGLPKAPSGYSPRRDLARARARREVVLAVLARERVATPPELAEARRAPLRVTRMEWEPARNVDSWALEVVRNTLDSLRRSGDIPAGIADADLIVRSTFDRRAQSAAERVVAWGAAQTDALRGGVARDERTQGALVALDPGTGAIRAIVGGRRVERKGFNRALRSQRQPGSAFKPFVYAAAMQNGFTPATLVDDSPVAIETGTALWTPANYGGEYAGRITLRDALTRSANAATVRVSRDIGIEAVIHQAHAQGITSELPEVPALALGAGGVTPLELTAAYAPFSNGGMRVTPHVLESVQDVFGRVLWQSTGSATARALESTDAFLVTSLLRSVVDRGTGYAVRQYGIEGPAAGKTGTTNDGADVWFVGFTPTIVAGVWFGADNPTSLGGGASGGRIAAPVWARFVREGWHSPELDTEWAPPLGIQDAEIDVATGMLASDWCGPSRREYFRVGTVPTESCENEARYAMTDSNPPDWHVTLPDSMDDIDSLPEVGAVIGTAISTINAMRTNDRTRELARSARAISQSVARELEQQLREQLRHNSETRVAARKLSVEMRRIAERETRRLRDAQRRVTREFAGTMR